MDGFGFEKKWGQKGAFLPAIAIMILLVWVEFSKTPHQQIIDLKKTMTDSPIDGVMLFCILITIVCFEALVQLITILQQGVLRSQREILLEKTNKQLRAMLPDHKGLSNLKKQDLVDLLLS